MALTGFTQFELRGQESTLVSSLCFLCCQDAPRNPGNELFGYKLGNQHIAWSVMEYPFLTGALCCLMIVSRGSGSSAPRDPKIITFQ
eukprot:767341-Hanusia_phi.AAC.3